MPERERRRPPRWLLVTAGAVVVLTTVVVAIVRSIGPEPWEQAAIDMAREFRILALPPDPSYVDPFGPPDNGKWSRPLEGISTRVTYREGQTLDSIQQSAETATDRLGLYPAVCIQVGAEEGYERSGSRSRDGMLGCSIFDADKHPVGWLEATQDGEQTTVWLTFGEGRRPLRWVGVQPEDLP